MHRRCVSGPGSGLCGDGVDVVGSCLVWPTFLV